MDHIEVVFTLEQRNGWILIRDNFGKICGLSKTEAQAHKKFKAIRAKILKALKNEQKSKLS